MRKPRVSAGKTPTPSPLKGVLISLSLAAIFCGFQDVFAQATNNAPYSQPDHSLITAKVSAPHSNRNNGPANILIEIKANSGTLPLAIPYENEGWSVYTSSGASCNWSVMQPQNAPVLHRGELENNRDPNSFTANAQRPALIPLNMICDIKRGDEVSLTITVYVLQSGNWIPHQFAWQRLIAQ